MFAVLQVLTVITVALAAALAVAHTLELPGKKRLDRDTYFVVQTIYYPDFTIGGGISEAGGLLLTGILLFLTPPGTVTFWLVLVAFLGMVGMQAVFWMVTQPVNRYWFRAHEPETRTRVQGQPMSRFAEAFFKTKTPHEGPVPDWTALRDRWEYSHVARAVMTSASLLALVVSLVVQPYCSARPGLLGPGCGCMARCPA